LDFIGAYLKRCCGAKPTDRHPWICFSTASLTTLFFDRAE